MQVASGDPTDADPGARVAAGVTGAQERRSGNPILPGWYADPEAHVFAGEYGIHPTYSAPYDEQLFMDAFSSKDLVTWVKHPRGVARSRSPAGPFVDDLGRPLIDRLHDGAQPIDQMVFRDADGAYYIVHHRRPLGETDRNHRVVSIDELRFNADGTIEPVRITREGVAADFVAKR